MNRAEKIAAIVGITEAIKQMGVPSKFCPAIAIIVGAIFGYAENQTSQGILDGVILGATVTGSYAVVKKSSVAILESDKPAAMPMVNDAAFLEHDDDRGV